MIELARQLRAAAGGDVDDRVRSLLDPRQERREAFRALIRLAGFGIAGMKMQDRSAGLGGDVEGRVQLQTNGSLNGAICLNNGDEASFIAQKWTSSAAC